MTLSGQVIFIYYGGGTGRDLEEGDLSVALGMGEGNSFLFLQCLIKGADYLCTGHTAYGTLRTFNYLLAAKFLILFLKLH